MNNPQSGNAVVFILIAIALFGALSYTFMRGAQTGQGNLTAGQAKLAAIQIMNTTADMDKTYNRLLQKGCSQDEISFEHNGIRVNSHAPSDLSCHMFSGENGMAYAKPPEIAQAKPISDPNGFNWYITNDNKFSGVGTNTNIYGRDTAIILPGLSQGICQEINVKADMGNVIPVEGGRNLNITNALSLLNSSASTGTLHSCDDNGIPCEATTFCVNQTGSIYPGSIPAGYTFIKIIHIR